MPGAGAKRQEQEPDPRPEPGGASADTSEAAVQPAPEPPAGVRWALLVQKIQTGDQQGMEELYKIFSRGVKFYVWRHLGTRDLDDRIHDIFLLVVEAIRNGDLRDPDKLLAFVRTVVRRQVAGQIKGIARQRQRETALDTKAYLAVDPDNPEAQAMARERVEIMKEVLDGISPRDREILTRFYLRGQSEEQICREMDLTHNQFRMLKYRAKMRFGEMGKRRLRKRRLQAFFMRFSGSR